MAISDYDAPRRPVVELEDDSLEELKARRAGTQSPTVDLDEPDGDFALPGGGSVGRGVDGVGGTDGGGRVPLRQLFPGPPPKPTRRSKLGSQAVPRLRLALPRLGARPGQAR